MSIGYLGALGAFTTTTLLREATVYAGPSTDADVVVVFPANTLVSVEQVADRAGWLRFAREQGTGSWYGYVQRADVNMPMETPRAPTPSIGPATKVFAGVVGFALLYLVVTR